MSPSDLPLISASLLIIVVISGALRSGWKECATRNRKREEKIVDRMELTDVEFSRDSRFGDGILEGNELEIGGRTATYLRRIGDIMVRDFGQLERVG